MGKQERKDKKKERKKKRKEDPPRTGGGREGGKTGEVWRRRERISEGDERRMETREAEVKMIKRRWG